MSISPTCCRHCGQPVASYARHFPRCPTVRAALDDDFWPLDKDHYTLSPADRERVKLAAGGVWQGGVRVGHGRRR